MSASISTSFCFLCVPVTYLCTGTYNAATQARKLCCDWPKLFEPWLHFRSFFRPVLYRIFFFLANFRVWANREGPFRKKVGPTFFVEAKIKKVLKTFFFLIFSKKGAGACKCILTAFTGKKTRAMSKKQHDRDTRQKPFTHVERRAFRHIFTGKKKSPHVAHEKIISNCNPV